MEENNEEVVEVDEPIIDESKEGSDMIDRALAKMMPKEIDADERLARMLQ